MLKVIKMGFMKFRQTIINYDPSDVEKFPFLALQSGIQRLGFLSWRFYSLPVEIFTGKCTTNFKVKKSAECLSNQPFMAH